MYVDRNEISDTTRRDFVFVSFKTGTSETCNEDIFSICSNKLILSKLICLQIIRRRHMVYNTFRDVTSFWIGRHV